MKNQRELTLPDLRHGGLPVAPTAALIGTYKNYLADAPLATPVMHPNDGLINTDNTLAPSTEAVRAYRSVNDCYPGEWYQMPIWEGNSLGYLGVFQRPLPHLLFVGQNAQGLVPVLAHGGLSYANDGYISHGLLCSSQV